MSMRSVNTCAVLRKKPGFHERWLEARARSIVRRANARALAEASRQAIEARRAAQVI